MGCATYSITKVLGQWRIIEGYLQRTVKWLDLYFKSATWVPMWRINLGEPGLEVSRAPRRPDGKVRTRYWAASLAGRGQFPELERMSL